jgi:hypothetical protein
MLVILLTVIPVGIALRIGRDIGLCVMFFRFTLPYPKQSCGDALLVRDYFTSISIYQVL